MKSETPSDALILPGLLPKIQAAAAEERRQFSHDEVHAKIAQGLESLRQGKGLDGETVMAELLAELDEPQRVR